MSVGIVLRLIMLFFSALLCACTITENSRPDFESGASWAANGYYGPLRSRDPNIIGTYQSKHACEDALDEWLSTQVVGTEISGECLPIDHD